VTAENRAVNRLCPECDTNPILRDDGYAFCDRCNRDYDTAVLVE